MEWVATFQRERVHFHWRRCISIGGGALQLEGCISIGGGAILNWMCISTGSLFDLRVCVPTRADAFHV